MEIDNLDKIVDYVYEFLEKYKTQQKMIDATRERADELLNLARKQQAQMIDLIRKINELETEIQDVKKVNEVLVKKQAQSPWLI